MSKEPYVVPEVVWTVENDRDFTTAHGECGKFSARVSTWLDEDTAAWGITDHNEMDIILDPAIQENQKVQAKTVEEAMGQCEQALLKLHRRQWLGERSFEDATQEEIAEYLGEGWKFDWINFQRNVKVTKNIALAPDYCRRITVDRKGQVSLDLVSAYEQTVVVPVNTVKTLADTDKIIGGLAEACGGWL